MSFAVMPIEDYKNTCDKVREKTGSEETIKSGELAEKIDEVYLSGYFDLMQLKGRRSNYLNYFNSFDLNYFYPKYDIRLSGNNNSLFSTCGRDINTSKSQDPIDLTQRMEECGKVLDTSECTSFRYMFSYACFKRLPVIDCTSADMSLSPFVGMFQATKEGHWTSPSLVTIDKIILSEDGAYLNGMWNTNSRTKNVVFEGLIIKDVTVQNAPFTADSAKSLIGCLKNYAGTDEELKYTVSLNSGIWERLNASGAPPSENTWEEYINTLGYNVASV